MKKQRGFTRMGWDFEDRQRGKSGKAMKRQYHKKERMYAKKMMATEIEII